MSRSTQATKALEPWSAGTYTDLVALASDVAQLLVSNATVRSGKQIDGKALTTADVRTELVGEQKDPDVARELDNVFGQLLGPQGRVQEAIQNSGRFLCQKRIRRPLEGGGDVSRVGRFVTTDLELVATYWAEGEIYQKPTRAIRRAQQAVEFGVKRQPELEAKIAGLVEQTHERVLKELPKRTA